MNIERVSEDKDLLALHAKRPMGYELSPSSPDFIVKNGMYDEGNLVAAVLGRVTAETYLLLDPQWKSPQERWEAVKRLMFLSAREAQTYGILDTYVSVSPDVKCFSRRLQRSMDKGGLGFVRAPWDLLTVKL